MNKVLYIFLVVLLLLLFATGLFVLYKEMVSVSFVSRDFKPSLEEIPVDSMQDSNWLENFSNSSNKIFQYPATELFVKFDFSDNDASNVTTSIEMKDLDEHKYFCVSQILKQSKLENTYYKIGNKLRLVVFIRDKDKLKKFLGDLDYCKIQYLLN
ncbi:MAG: hypothetical protein MSA68_07760 [Helicobacter sp.]|nr:hypothetical protein [Helicobacter sp.]